MKKDRLFEKNGDMTEPFNFGREVAEVFDDMAARSIPCYGELQYITARLARDYYRKGSRIYDLGCSTGNTVLTLIEIFGGNDAADFPDITAVDSSPEMIEIAREKCGNAPVQWRCSGIEDMPFPDASVIIASYILQFIDPVKRPKAVKEMYRGLRDGGILIMAEKMKSGDAGLESVLTELYHDFKRRMGYSDLEIRRKAAALEGVLIPFTMEENLRMLANAGFSRTDTFLKSYNFTCILAVK